MISLDELLIVENSDMVDRVEDWSRVRSPSRAERRRRQGHRQNVVTVSVPKKCGYRLGNVLYVHPAVAQLLRDVISRGRT